MSKNKGKKYPPQPLSREEVDRLIESFSTRASTGIRNRALVACLYRGSLRIGETLALRDADLDMDRCTARVLHGKGDVSRLVVLDRKTIEMVQAWQQRREELGITSGTLFCTLAGKVMDRGDFCKSLKLRGKQAGIVKRIYSHALRHSGASSMADEGMPLRVIQEQLGHSAPSVTDAYIRKLNPTERIELLKDREW